jgi:hypothetical protein
MRRYIFESAFSFPCPSIHLMPLSINRRTVVNKVIDFGVPLKVKSFFQ